MKNVLMDLYIHRVCSKLRKKVRLLGRLLSSVPNEILKLFIIHVLSQQYIIGLLCEILHRPNLFANFKVFKNGAPGIITGSRDWCVRRLLQQNALVKQLGGGGGERYRKA